MPQGLFLLENDFINFILMFYKMKSPLDFDDHRANQALSDFLELSSEKKMLNPKIVSLHNIQVV